MNRFIGLGLSGVLLSACSGTDQPASVGEGGSSSQSQVGGAAATGGNPTTSGGANNAGGVAGTGGSRATGGNVSASGGANSTGGIASTGGSKTTGGNSSAGGAQTTGGKASTGSNSTATGGTNGVGGLAGTGGSKLTGGNTSTGGNATQSTGGSASTGGTKSTGGNANTGGVKATGGNASTGGTNASSPLLVPAQGALLGAFVGTGTFDQLETTLGRKLAIIHTFVGWNDDWTSRLAGDIAGGRIPLITWETWNAGVGVPLDDIINGVYDSMITSRAQASKNLGQKFFLRWGHEMNGNWYPWDGSHNGASAAATAKYISTYHHIHDLFVSAGATNVLWVFCPNVDSVPGDAWNQWSNYYPGDTYVDWMGLDGYNWGTVQTGSTWQSFTAIVGRIYSGLAAKNKPIMIPETASAELGGDKAAWIAGIVPALRSSYPSIKALVWFHMNKETDWRLDSSTTARAASITMANDPYFNP